MSSLTPSSLSFANSIDILPQLPTAFRMCIIVSIWTVLCGVKCGHKIQKSFLCTLNLVGIRVQATLVVDLDAYPELLMRSAVRERKIALDTIG